MKEYPKTVISDALMLHHSISALKGAEQIAFAMDCVYNMPLKKMFCPTDRIFMSELRETLNATLDREAGALDELALMIPLLSEMCAELYEATRSHLVDAKEHSRSMAASHLGDAYLGLSELVYAHVNVQKCISSAHDVAKNVRQSAYWLTNSLEREKFEMVYQQKKVEKHLYGTKTKAKPTAQILKFQAK